MKLLELDIISSIDELHAYAVGVCKDYESGDCISANFVHTSGGQMTTTTYQQPLTDAGYFTGSSTVTTKPLPWPGGCTPAYIGVTKDGPHQAGWCGDWLYYAGPNDQAPTMIGGIDEVNWPFVGFPPTALGFYGDSNPYVVTLGADSIPAFMIRDTTLTTPLPEGTVVTETATVQASQGGPNPSAMVLPGDRILVHYQDITRFVQRTWWGAGCDSPAWADLGDKKTLFGITTSWWVQQCGASDNLLLTIKTENDEGNPQELGEIVLEGDFSNMSLKDLKIDGDGNLHIAFLKEETDADGNMTESVVYIKIDIDYNQVNWGFSALWHLPLVSGSRD